MKAFSKMVGAARTRPAPSCGANLACSPRLRRGDGPVTIPGKPPPPWQVNLQEPKEKFEAKVVTVLASEVTRSAPRSTPPVRRPPVQSKRPPPRRRLPWTIGPSRIDDP